MQAGLPSWGRLLRIMVEQVKAGIPDAPAEELESLLERNKFLEVAEYCKDQLGKNQFASILAENVSGRDSPIPEAHRLIANTPFAGVITTNYDKLLERGYVESGKGMPKTPTPDDTAMLGPLLFQGGFYILKAHGDIDRVDNVVLTASDYRRISHANPAFEALFSAILLTKTVLFVGYSLNDPDFNLLLDRVLTHFKGYLPERYALMTGLGKIEADILFRATGLRVIPYENPDGRHEQVVTFLRDLQRATSPEPVAARGVLEARCRGPGDGQLRDPWNGGRAAGDAEDRPRRGEQLDRNRPRRQRRRAAGERPEARHRLGCTAQRRGGRDGVSAGRPQRGQWSSWERRWPAIWRATCASVCSSSRRTASSA